MLRYIILTITLYKLSECIVLNYNTTYIINYIKNRNYPIEVHTIQTDDGYILNVHRIPFIHTNVSGKGAVLLVHGLQESAEHWIINNKKSLAFLLSNLGYDVWMLNSRGCYHSQNHATIDKSDSRYWDFSWHEIGIYDLPKTIDYILATTGLAKISYIGHSQGVTSFLVLTSLKPNYNDKIKIMIGLAPAAYMFHVRNPVFRSLSLIWEFIDPQKSLLDNVLINNIAENMCREQIFIQNICSNMLFLMSGYNFEQLDKTLVPDIMRIMPAGSSTKQFVHYLQLVKSGYFRQYDYFTRANFQRYDKSTPSKYNLNNVTAKIALYYARNDWLATLEIPCDKKYQIGQHVNTSVHITKLGKMKSKDISQPTLAQCFQPMSKKLSEQDFFNRDLCHAMMTSNIPFTYDVRRLRDELPNVVVDHLIEYDSFNHWDFLFAKDVIPFLYNHVLDVLNAYN